MTTTEIAEVKKLIKDIKNKLNEIERAIDKSPRKKYSFQVNTQTPSPRKRNVYRDTENNMNNS